MVEHCLPMHGSRLQPSAHQSCSHKAAAITSTPPGSSLAAYKIYQAAGSYSNMAMAAASTVVALLDSPDRHLGACQTPKACLTEPVKVSAQLLTWLGSWRVGAGAVLDFKCCRRRLYVIP